MQCNFNVSSTSDGRMLKTFNKLMKCVCAMYCNQQCISDARRQIPEDITIIIFIIIIIIIIIII